MGFNSVLGGLQSKKRTPQYMTPLWHPDSYSSSGKHFFAFFIVKFLTQIKKLNTVH